MAKQISFEFPPKGHVGLLVYDSVNDDWYAVLGDADGHIQLDVLASALPSGAATAAKQLADDHNVNVSNMITGFATAAKQLADGHNVTVDNATLAVLSGDDKIFAFESIVEEALSDTNLAAGGSVLGGATVPDGKVWMITGAVIRYDGTSPTRISIVAGGLATGLTLLVQASPTSALWYIWGGEVYLQVGDNIQGAVIGATAGDDLYFRYAGVQMDAP